MDFAFWQDLGKMAVAELGSGSRAAEPFSLAYVPRESTLAPPLAFLRITFSFESSEYEQKAN